MALRVKRTRNNYRGVKINDNVYSGFLECGDCGSPMFAMSRRDLAPAYTCGTYHRRGLAGCTSHHIRVDKLDELLKSYVLKLLENSSAMIEQLNRDLARENDSIAETEQSADNLAAVLEELEEEMKVTKRQRIREIMKKPDREAEIEATYDELEAELQQKIDGLNHQIDLLSDKRNTVIKVNRAAKTALEVFRDILSKDKLDRNDLELIIDRVLVYEDHLEIKLQRDIDSILRSGTLEETVNFNQGIENSLQCRLIQSARNQKDKVFDVSVISNGDPLEIFTDRDGEVIFKKYSPIGELGDFAAQICDSLHRSTDAIAAVCDRDSIIAVSGASKRDFIDKRVSPALERVMESRGSVRYDGTEPMHVIDGDERYYVSVASPILSEGDILGCVIFVSQNASAGSDIEFKLAQTVASFLGKQMES